MSLLAAPVALLVLPPLLIKVLGILGGFGFLFLVATLLLLLICWVKRRYCLAGITKLGERVAKNTKLE